MATNISFHCEIPRRLDEFIGLGNQHDVDVVPRKGDFISMRLDAEFQKQLKLPNPDGGFEVVAVVWAYEGATAFADIYLKISDHLVRTPTQRRP